MAVCPDSSELCTGHDEMGVDDAFDRNKANKHTIQRYDENKKIVQLQNKLSHKNRCSSVFFLFIPLLLFNSIDHIFLIEL